MLGPVLKVTHLEDGSICLGIEYRPGKLLSIQVAPEHRGQLQYCLLPPRKEVGPALVPVRIKEG